MNSQRMLWRLLLLSILIAIAGCSQYSSLTKVEGSYYPLPDEWRIKAKLGVRTDADSGSVTVDWRQQKDRYGIHINGPFGRGSAKIEGDPQLIRIEQVGKRVVTSTTPEQLLQETLGWFIPINDLRYWVQGLPNSDKPINGAVYDEHGKLIAFEQADWLISISRYRSVEKWLLPHRVKFSKEDIQLTLAIRQWQFL